MRQKQQSEPYVSRYLHGRGKAMGIPVAGNFELTARCNFNCPMCYVHMTPEQLKQSGKSELTAAQWLSIAKEARDMGMIFALLTGGEPLVRRDFFEIYRGMKDMGILLSINSNGSMLSGEVLERFLADPPARFNISLYGGSNATYQNMCGLPVYDRVKANIRALRQAGVEVGLNLSITPYNKDDIERIYDDAVELDVNVKASAYMYPSIRVNGGQFGCGNRLSAEDAAMLNHRWDRIRFDDPTLRQRMEGICALNSAQNEGCPLEEGEGVRCRAGSTSFWMTWDGRMLPCGMMPGPTVYPLETGFRAAWETLREETAKIHTPAKCASCPKQDICAMCAAVCVTETGEFDQVPEYVCRMTDETIRLAEEFCGKGKTEDED